MKEKLIAVEMKCTICNHAITEYYPKDTDFYKLLNEFEPNCDCGEADRREVEEEN